MRLAEPLIEKTVNPYTLEALAEIVTATPELLACIDKTTSMKRILYQMSKSARRS